MRVAPEPITRIELAASPRLWQKSGNRSAAAPPWLTISGRSGLYVESGNGCFVFYKEQGFKPVFRIYNETGADWIWAKLGNPCLNQLPEGLSPAGEHEGCVTAEGAFDLMGNLHEWTADPAGTFRGGFYVDTKGNGPGCTYVTTAHDVSYWDYSTGFRCCSDR